MIRKLTLAVGFGAGYVLGARAGKERYQQIEAKVRELLGHEQVQDFTHNVSSSAGHAADRAKATVNEKVEAVSDKLDSAGSSDVVDLNTGNGPIVGAGPEQLRPRPPLSIPLPSS